MKYCFILNPRAGPARERAALAPLLAAFIATHRLDATIVATELRAHATELAHQAVARGCDVVVAVGGDGTMNEVARALVDSPAALGLIPRGSGNGLARHLGIPLAPSAALAALLASSPRLIDVGEANGRVFFCAMGAGFDAAVLTHFERLPMRGLSAYLVAATRLFFRYRCESYALHLGSELAPAQPALLVAVANCDQFGNNARLAPGARADDGLLNLVLIPPVNFFSALPLLARLFAGSLDRSPRVRRWTGDHFVITRETPGPMHVDGELVETTAAISIRLRPAALRVLAPSPAEIQSNRE